jgi:hypothetical protein
MQMPELGENMRPFSASNFFLGHHASWILFRMHLDIRESFSFSL